jgi:hypothetical protein
VKKIRLLALALLLIAPSISKQLFDGPLPMPECPPSGCAFN